MKLTKSENHDPNYLAAVIEVKSIRDHSNADRLSIVSVFGNDCIVGRDTQVGDVFIYFPLECQISLKILSAANLFSDPNTNADGTTKGFFEKKGRVKALRLRQEKSCGFLMQAKTFADATGYDESQFRLEVGEEFDTLDGELVCNKYIVNKRQTGEPGEKREKVEDKHSIARRLVPNQFRFHYSTPHLGRNSHLLTPDSIISITEKLHGQNGVFCKVLVNVIPSWKDKLAKKLGVQTKEKEYQFIYSSRSVMKTRRDGSIGEDQWGKHAHQISNKIPPGYSVMGEVVGFTPSGGGIQKAYDYKCEPFQSALKVFRITYTDPTGEVLELGWLDIVRFCEKYGLETVPGHYYGRAGNLFDIVEDEFWNENFLKALENKYLDKPCPLCNSKVINEGVVISIEDKINRPVFKYKSFGFLEKESKDRDKGEPEPEEN